MSEQALRRIQSAIITVPDFPSPGIQFKDITPILRDAELLRLGADLLAAPFLNTELTHIAGIESRGFIMGAMMAERLNCGFIPIRKSGKLPRETYSQSYDLEYGSSELEIHLDDLSENDLVVVHDDVLATGGTAAATTALINQTGAKIVGFSFIMELSFLGGRSKISDFSCDCLLSY